VGVTFGVDLILSGVGPVVVDVNPRLNFVRRPRALGINAAE
jgi:predicted ATP-grasp superfamily ATP-dependent carboligase